MTQVIKIAMRVPNKAGIYAPSRIFTGMYEKDLTDFSSREILVSFDEDGISNPQRATAYANGLDAWWIKA